MCDSINRPQEGENKRNFGKIFNRSVFFSTTDVYVVDRFKRKKIDSSTVKYKTEKKSVIDGRPFLEFLRKHRLNYDSLTHEWLEAIIIKHMVNIKKYESFAG